MIKKKKKKMGVKRGRANREKRERERGRGKGEGGRGKEVRKKKKNHKIIVPHKRGRREYEKGFLAQKLPVGNKKENTDQTRPNPT